MRRAVPARTAVARQTILASSLTRARARQLRRSLTATQRPARLDSRDKIGHRRVGYTVGVSIVNRIVDAIVVVITAPFRAIAALFGRRRR